jgi:hypothetical protein
MKIDLMMYRANLSALRAYHQANLNLSLSDLITNYAVSSHVPLIVCAFYMAKIKGMDEETQEFIEKLKRFYRYDEIVGIKELMEL